MKIHIGWIALLIIGVGAWWFLKMKGDHSA